jgi:hypothetical protein
MRSDTTRHDVESGNAFGLTVRFGKPTTVHVAGTDEVDEHIAQNHRGDGRRTDTELLPFSRIDRSAPFTLNAYTMYAEWVAAEHYRLHVIEQWPEGPRKAVALSATRSSLQSSYKTTNPTVCCRRARFA